jgi:hypothetical protein
MAAIKDRFLAWDCGMVWESRSITSSSCHDRPLAPTRSARGFVFVEVWKPAVQIVGSFHGELYYRSDGRRGPYFKESLFARDMNNSYAAVY